MTIEESSPPRERVGSSKIMFAMQTGLLQQVDRGLTSIFDRGVIPGFQSTTLARARTVQTACALKWLEHNGFHTHWHASQRWPEAEELIVHEAQVGDLPLLSDRADLDVIGLELLFRVRASEKFCGRVE